MKKCILPLVIILLAGIAFTHAGPLSPKQIDVNAAWVLHMNVREFNSTQLAQHLQGPNGPASFKDNVALYKDSLGFNPLKDIEHFTFYGTNARERDGVALFTGKFDAAKITAQARKRADCKVTQKGPRSILSWTDPRSGQQLQMCFASGDQMVVAIGNGQIQSALDVLDGRKPNLSSGGALTFPSKARGFFLASAVPESTGISMLQNAKALNLTIGEATRGMVDLWMSVESRDEPTAAATLQVVQGLLLSALITAKQNPELAELAQSASVTSEGAAVIVQVQYPAAKAIDMISRMANSPAKSSAPETSQSPTDSQRQAQASAQKK